MATQNCGSEILLYTLASDSTHLRERIWHSCRKHLTDNTECLLVVLVECLLRLTDEGAQQQLEEVLRLVLDSTMMLQVFNENDTDSFLRHFYEVSYAAVRTWTSTRACPAASHRAPDQQ